MRARKTPRKGAPRANSGGPRPARPHAPVVPTARPQRPRPSAATPGSQRVTSLIVDALAHALAQVLRFEGPADAVMSRYFREHPNLGSRDRSVVAEGIFHALRRLATL